jgi:Holliday junction resolvasome RuvABC endonuclease subunit
MASPPIILGIDSASRAGWALVQGEKLLEHNVVTEATNRLRQDALAAYVCSKNRPDLVVIEDNFLSANVATLKVLARMVGAWEMSFAVRGVETTLMIPESWRAATVKALVPKKPVRADWKLAAKTWVRSTYGVTVGEDEAEAICMASAVARTMAFDQRIRRAEAGSIPRRAI